MVKSLKCKKKKKKKPQARETLGISRGQDSPSKKRQKTFYCLREEENPTFLATKRLLHALIKLVGN